MEIQDLAQLKEFLESIQDSDHNLGSEEDWLVNRIIKSLSDDSLTETEVGYMKTLRNSLENTSYDTDVTKDDLITEYLYETSKSLDENRYDIRDLPYQSAFLLLAGVDKEPDKRVGDEQAVWQILDSDDDELTEEDYEEAKKILRKYRFKDADELSELYQSQKNIAAFFSVDIRFDKYDVRFAKDLTKRINEGKMLSNEQFDYLKYFIYRYREQLMDQIIYEEHGSDRLWEFLGDDPRETFNQVIVECKVVHSKVNPRQ